jgi:hypothetical protein
MLLKYGLNKIFEQNFDNHLVYLSKNEILNEIASLKRLDLDFSLDEKFQNVNLDKPNAFDLIEFKRLNKLNIQNFKSVNSEVFSHLKASSLEELHLSRCMQNPYEIYDEEIQLNDEILKNIQKFTNLKILALNAMNAFSINNIPIGSFKPFAKLTQLSLSVNKIVLYENMFKDLVNLKELELEECCIKELKPNCFYGLFNLELLNLAKNYMLSSLDANMLNGLNSLKNLTFYNCMIQEIASDSFKYTPNLEKLDFNGNG